MYGSPDSPYAGPMRIQARPGSPVEKLYAQQTALARGLTRDAEEDLIFRGGKTVPQMEFQNIFPLPLHLVLQEVAATNSTKRVPVQFMYSNAVHGAEGPIAAPHP